MQEKSQLIQGAKRSLFDPNLGVVPEENFRRDTPKLLKQEIAGTGQIQQQKTWYEGDPCFAAGTLVHTKEGLVPIEQIKVGDWVLSKHESGQGEQAYKQVMKTFVHDDAQVTLLSYRVQQPDQSELGGVLAVTPNHPFWVPGKGWKKAETLKQTLKGMPLAVFDGRPAVVYRNVNLYITASASIAWVPSTSSPSALDYTGAFFELGKETYVRDTDSEYAKSAYFGVDIGLPPSRPAVKHLFKTRVYNFEVENFHTYYVGKHGIWVHNKNTQISHEQWRHSADD